jgi:hypothetical protein
VQQLNGAFTVGATEVHGVRLTADIPLGSQS